ncbi:MAG: NUDIX domain-containing protein [Bacillota bacterium]
METVIVNVAILEENNKYLIIQRDDNNNEAITQFWEFPGGKLLPGEDPEHGLVRNIQETLDIDITIMDIFKVASHIVDDKHVIILAYLCIRNFGEPKKKGCKDYKWVTLDELRSGRFDFSKSDKKIINKISIFSGCGPSLVS